MRLRDTAHYGLRFAENALRRRGPRIVYLEVTKRCNAFCDFCPYWKTHRRDELQDYSPIVRKLEPFCVTFTGGEPLLRRDIVDLVGAVTRLPKRPYTALLSNGWLMSADKARALREAGLEQISISLDYRGELHDKQRGLPGLYARIEERIPQWRATGLRVVINTVLMESNLDHILPICDLTARWGVLVSFSCYSTLKTDSPGELVGNSRLAELRRVIAEVRRRKRRQPHIISSDFYLDHAVRYFENGGHVGAQCTSAGKRFVHVDPWGYVKICPEFAPFAHWTELDVKRPAAHDCTRCWYGCRGENEAPVTWSRVRDLRLGIVPSAALLRRGALRA